jgi:hypothetical protein
MKMMKVEVVADSYTGMADQLAALAEIYRVGASYLHKHADAIARQAGLNLEGSPRRETIAFAEIVEPEVVEPKKRGRKKAEAPKDFTEEDIRTAMIDHCNKASQAHGVTRQTVFNNLCKHFGVDKLKDLPVEKYGEMIAHVEAQAKGLDELLATQPDATD